MPITLEDKLKQRLQDPNIALGQKLRQRLESQPKEINQEQSNQLLDVLRGKLPSMEPEKLPPLAGGPGPLSAVGKLTQQQEAFKELQASGMSPEQIRLSSQTRKILGGARIGRGIGGISGALAATAIAGRVIPGPFDDAAIMGGLIAAGGAGMGGLAGEATQTGIEEKRLISKREALKAFAIEAGTELGGRGVVRGGKFIASPFIKKIVPEAVPLIDDFAKVGGHYSPTELDKRFSLRIGEAFSRGGFGAKEIFQEFEEKQGRAVLAYADTIIESIGEGIARQSPEEIGDLFAKGITRPNGKVFQILDDLFDPLYNQLDDLTKSSIVKQTAEISVPSTILDETGKPFNKMVTKVIGERIKGTGVNTASLKTFRKRIIAQNQRLVDIAKRTGKELPLASPAGKQILSDIDNLPEIIGHSDYRAFRTKVLKETRKLNRDVDISEGMVKRISSITRKELLNPESVAGASQQTKRLHANISNLYAKAQEGLETTFSEKLAKRLLQNPSRIIKEVFPVNSPKSIRLLRESLVEPVSGFPSREGKVLWNQLRQQWLAEAVSDATKEGIAKPKVFDNIIRKMGAGFDEIFPEKEVASRVRKIQTLFETAGKTPPTGASLFSRGAQVYGVTKMYQGGQEGDFVGFTIGATLALGPLAFAKLATHPKGVKFLTAGFKMKPGATGMVPNTVRIIRLLKDIDYKERKAMLKKRKGQPFTGQLRGTGWRGF